MTQVFSYPIMQTEILLNIAMLTETAMLQLMVLMQMVSLQNSVLQIQYSSTASLGTILMMVGILMINRVTNQQL